MKQVRCDPLEDGTVLGEVSLQLGEPALLTSRELDGEERADAGLLHRF
jgi:hypothetical protein